MRRIATFGLSVLLVGPVLAAEVSYFEEDGTSVTTARGEILRESPTEVVVLTTSQDEVKIPFHRIDTVEYDRTPPEMINVRNMRRQGRHAEAIEELEEMIGDLDAVRDRFLKQSIEYALLEERIALARLGAADPKEVLKVYEAQAESLGRSRHHYPSLELLGQLYLQVGDLDSAAELLAKLAEVDAPGYSEKAQVYQGRVAAARERYDQALMLFDEAMASRDDSEAAERQRLLARIGKAEVMTASERAEEAENICRKLIQDLVETDKDGLFAAAHNALGDALRAQGKTKEAALEGYLWVHTLYADDEAEHARALFHLATLLDDVGYPVYADRMGEALRSSYGETDWAIKLGSSDS